jgi:hypothetical protein
VVAQTKPNGDVSLVDSAKQATQNSYDALGTLVFKDPAPPIPAKPAQPIAETYEIIDQNGRIYRPTVTFYPNGDVKWPDGDLQKANGDLLKTDGTLVKSDGTRIYSNGLIEKPNGDLVYPPGHKADTFVSPASRGLGSGLYNSSPETADLIAKTPSAEEIAQVLKDSAISKDPIDPYGKTLTAIGDFFTKPDPQTTNPFKSLANGAIALATDAKDGAINLGNAIKQFSQDPIGTVKYGVIGSGQSFVESVSNLADGWKWLLTSKPEAVIDSGKQFFGDLAAKEKAKMEENPGAYAFRGARDLYITLATSLFGGSSSTLSKTAGAADNINDAAKLVNKVENVADDVLPPTKKLEPTGNPAGAIDDSKTIQPNSQDFAPSNNLGGIGDDLPKAFLSPDEFASLPGTGKIESGKIRFSQDTINANFKPPFGSVDDFITDLKLGKVDPSSIKPIRLVEKDGQVFTLDNRRLHAFQQAGIDVPFQKLDRIPKRELFKFTTKNEGLKIEVRR